MRLVLLLVLILAACSSSATSARPESPTTQLSTSTRGTASVQQVASVIAQHRADLLAAMSADQKCISLPIDAAFELSEPPSLDFSTDRQLCEATLDGIPSEVQRLNEALGGVVAPDELSSLVSQTQSASVELQAQAAQMRRCLNGAPTASKVGDCVIWSQDLTNADRGMRQALAGWDAYL